MEIPTKHKAKHYHHHIALTVLLLFPRVLLAQFTPVGFTNVYNILCNNSQYSSAMNLLAGNLLSDLWFTKGDGSLIIKQETKIMHKYLKMKL